MMLHLYDRCNPARKPNAASPSGAFEGFEMRRLGRLGVWYPIDRLDGAGLRSLLSKVEELGFSTFWYPESLGYESLSIASFILANTSRLVVGSSIANIYARDP